MEGAELRGKTKEVLLKPTRFPVPIFGIFALISSAILTSALRLIPDIELPLPVRRRDQ